MALNARDVDHQRIRDGVRYFWSASQCAGAARYTVAVNGRHVTFAIVSDGCVERRMILDRSEWRPASEAIAVPERRIVSTDFSGRTRTSARGGSDGELAVDSRRQASGIADGQHLPDGRDREDS